MSLTFIIHLSLSRPMTAGIDSSPPPPTCDPQLEKRKRMDGIRVTGAGFLNLTMLTDPTLSEVNHDILLWFVYFLIVLTY